MSDSVKSVGLMVRLPADLHEEIRKYAAGSAKRPQASLNSTIVFLLRAGLSVIGAWESGDLDPLTGEQKSGPWAPELLEAA